MRRPTGAPTPSLALESAAVTANKSSWYYSDFATARICKTKDLFQARLQRHSRIHFGMKLPDAVVEKLKDKDAPVTHAAVIEGSDMVIRYTCDGKAIGQTMFPYTPEAWIDWFRSMMEEMSPGILADTKKKVKARGKRPPRPASRSRRVRSRKRSSRLLVKRSRNYRGP